MSEYRILFIDTIKNSDNYPPLGIGYLISSLRSKYKNDIINFKVINNNIENELNYFKPSIVGISCVSANYNLAINYSIIIKKYNLPIIIGGAHISMLPCSLTKDMDVGVLGEGEETICDLFEVYKNEGAFDKHKLKYINGIVYINEAGNYHVTPRRNLIQPLDRIPFPSRDILKIDSNTYMFTGRGCPYKCIFCSSTRFWDNVRLNSAEYVVNEIQQLYDLYNVKSVYFCDDIFILSIHRIKMMIKLLEEKGLLGKIRYSCACRSNLVNEKTISLLKMLGVTHITMGFESGCDKTLKYLKGNSICVKDHESAIRIIREYGIEIMGGFIVGSPEESKEDILETIDFIKRNQLINVSIYPLTPLPGTPIWDYAKKRNLVNDKMNWDLLSFSNFQYNKSASVHISEKMTRKELYNIIQLFRWQRRKIILKSLVKECFINPSKIPYVIVMLIKKIIFKLTRSYLFVHGNGYFKKYIIDS